MIPFDRHDLERAVDKAVKVPNTFHSTFCKNNGFILETRLTEHGNRFDVYIYTTDIPDAVATNQHPGHVGVAGLRVAVNHFHKWSSRDFWDNVYYEWVRKVHPYIETNSWIRAKNDVRVECTFAITAMRKILSEKTGALPFSDIFEIAHLFQELE